MRAGGWFGKIEKDGRDGTSNIGPVGGANDRPAGDATNVVTDYVLAQGESRSHDAKFVKEITAAYKAAFDEGRRGREEQRGQGRPRQIQEPDGLPSLPHEGDGAGGPAGGRGRHRAGPHRQRSESPTAASMPTGWCATASPP